MEAMPIEFDDLPIEHVIFHMLNYHRVDVRNHQKMGRNGLDW